MGGGKGAGIFLESNLCAVSTRNQALFDETAALTELDSQEKKGERANAKQREKGENSGAFVHSNFAPACIGTGPTGDRYSQATRERAANWALPLIAEGASVADVAAELGIQKSTLASWLIGFDDETYRKALAGQVARKFE